MLSDMDRPYGLVALPTECPEGVYFNISCAGLSFIKFNFNSTNEKNLSSFDQLNIFS